jgi:hypothetical protein
MLLDVGLHGKEILVDEISGLLVLVRLGIQPSTSASSRRSAEIEQDGPALLFRTGERLINVFAPIHGHSAPPPVVSRMRCGGHQGGN